MKRQTYNKYIYTRIEFFIAVGLFMEFDYEIGLTSDYPEPIGEDEWKELKKKVLKFELPETTDDMAKKGDISFPCMRYAKEFKQSPASIAERLVPYLEDFEPLEKIEVVGGYLNIYFDKYKFLQMQMEN